MRFRTNNVFAASLITTLVAMRGEATEFHVATNGSDAKAGTVNAPFRTIQHAADLAQPGDVITVHAGVYRERVNPPRSGTSDTNRIVYQAAPGEKVVITGAEPLKGWGKVTNDTWQVIIPNSFFGSFNPYRDVLHGDWCHNPGGYHTGAVYLDGDWLTETTKQAEVIKATTGKPLWFASVNATNTTIWAQFPGISPNAANVEINVRQTVFTPSQTGINYLTVRGFELRAAAAPWAPPTAAQIGIISAYWCKGWIIENNCIRYSPSCGVALGKYGDQFDNTSANSSAGYVATINRALTNGWHKATVGSHLVRNNEIAHCEQAGIVGSLGCSFSTITGNDIHDIHVRRIYSGAEMAGIKFHGGIDVVISHNNIYRCNRGIWLDWMAQGARITGNLLHDNAATDVNWSQNWSARTRGGEQDMFLEVNHGPVLVDNNIFLSPYSVNYRSQGVAFVHNLFSGAFNIVSHDERQTPYHKPHATEIVALHDNPCGDTRFYNNIFVERGDLSGFDTATLPMAMSGNIYLNGSKPSRHEVEPLRVNSPDTKLQLIQKSNDWYLTLATDKAWREAAKCKLVTTELLGKALIPNCTFENPDGSPLRITADYFGKNRNEKEPFPGPFESVANGKVVNLWFKLIPSSLKADPPILPVYTTEYQVAKNGSDANVGSASAPLRTIQRAADLAQPGDVITVHAGIYRERINPPRGGASETQRITYRAAPGEQVVITGAEPVKGWTKVTNDTWQVTIPNSFFGAFNPYRDLLHGDWCHNPGGYHTGAVYLDDDWLTETTKQAEVIKATTGKPLWFASVDATNTTIWAQFPGISPNAANVEINVRQSVFTPSQTSINYLTVAWL